MDVYARALRTSAIAVVAATTVTLTATPPVTGTAAAVHLTAAGQPLDPDEPASALVTLQQVAPAVADSSMLAPLTGVLTSIGDNIEGLFNAVEPWVAYGYNYLSYVVGFVPFVGLLAPQIIFFYDLDESVVASLLFNTIGVLEQTVSSGTAQANINADAMAAYAAFVDAENCWFQSIQPPPLPTEMGASGLADVPVGMADLAAVSDAGPIADVVPELGSMLLGLVP
ncbi:hypothetical protein [Mycobacterium sp.]|uniref:hypothetical protein n=1 Tax=Mycobacterium sp. TaxID=1785 RepID=UPI0031D85AAB